MSSEHAVLTLDDDDGTMLEFDALVSGPQGGTPVLLLHGWPQTARSFDVVTPDLASAGFRCAAVDQRGYSPHARPLGVAAYGLDHLVADAVGFIDSLGWPSAHVVGHDWGAAVAWALAARRPDLVRSLTALSIPHPASLAQALATDPEQQRLSAYIGVLRGPEGEAEATLLADDAARLRQVYAGAMPEHLVDAHVEVLSEPGAMTAALNYYRAMRGREWAELPEVRVPTTYVWGDTDAGIGAVAAHGCAEHVAAPFTHLVLPGAGHWLPEANPREVADAIIAQVAAVA